jgi:ATP-dependent DNA helicase HFM1/MER3
MYSHELFFSFQNEECIVKGIGYHNAGMDHKHRKLVEELFLNGDIKVLFSTSSL